LTRNTAIKQSITTPVPVLMCAGI